MNVRVKNPKGRAVSVISALAWSGFLAMLFLGGDWGILQVLLAILFALLLALSGLRIYQEWAENGDWLD